MESRLVYGVHAVRKALAHGRVERVWLRQDPGAGRVGRLADDIARAAVPVTPATAAELEHLLGTAKHQGIAARVRHAPSLSEREARQLLASLEAPLVLVLDSIQDPRNFGSLLRTADAAGVDLVVTGRSRNVSVTPVVSKVASGAAEFQAIAEVSNLARFLAQATADGIRVIGTDDSADTSIFEADLTGPLAVVMGAEGEGMRRLTRERCDQLVHLPMHGVVESLNVAVAAGICLYECLRQRSRLAPGDGLR